MGSLISNQAKAGIDQIFMQSTSSLLLDAADSVEVVPLRDSELADKDDGQVLVLTIASYHFRLLVMFHIGADPAVERYFSGADAGTRSFDGAFGEVGNLCCGAMKRDLGQYFPHTGMSTPYLLEARCLAFLGALKPDYVSRHRVVINGMVSMRATLCLCAYAPIDFRLQAQTPVADTGVLELF